MLKFERRYRAEFTIGSKSDTGQFVPEETVIIEYPFTCQFSIDLGIYTSSNSAQFQFINLPKEVQAKLWLDIFNRGKKYINMVFYAGYGDNLAACFYGILTFCTSQRASGSVDFVTEMTANNTIELARYGFLNRTYTQGTRLYEILKAVVQESNLKLGYVTPELDVEIPRDKTFIGQTLDLLGREYGGYEIYIDNDQLNILGENDVVPGEIMVITDDSGLLGSPRRANAYTEVDLLFEPQLKAGQAIELMSKSMPQFNRAYKIVQIKHTGIISPVVCGKLTTTAILTMFEEEPRPLDKPKVATYNGKATNGIWQKPVNGVVSSPFGKRAQPTKGASTNHKGMDIAAPINTPVFSPANGLVIFAGWQGGYGKTIEIDNGYINNKKVSSLFGHLNSWIVQNNQAVTKGDLIGYVGSTGVSTGSHLHFEVKEDGKQVNPTIYIGNYG